MHSISFLGWHSLTSSSGQNNGKAISHQVTRFQTPLLSIACASLVPLWTSAATAKLVLHDTCFPGSLWGQLRKYMGKCFVNYDLKHGDSLWRLVGARFIYRAWPVDFSRWGSPSLKYLCLRAASPSALWMFDVYNLKTCHVLFLEPTRALELEPVALWAGRREASRSLPGAPLGLRLETIVSL